MSFFVLDTDTVSLYERGQPLVVSRVENCPALLLAITVITAEEQLAGRFAALRKAKTSEETAQAYRLFAQTARFLGSIRILDFDENAIKQFQSLQVAKLNIGSYDLRIAAIVLEAGATLVTRNARDFGRVPGLTFVNWAD